MWAYIDLYICIYVYVYNIHIYIYIYIIIGGLRGKVISLELDEGEKQSCAEGGRSKIQSLGFPVDTTTRPLIYYYLLKDPSKYKILLLRIAPVRKIFIFFWGGGGASSAHSSLYNFTPCE